MSGGIPCPDAESARLTLRVTGFIRYLRRNDFSVGHTDAATTLAVLAGHPLGRITEARQQLKILLSGSKPQWDSFDELFEAYWLRRGRERVLGRPAPTGTSGGSSVQSLGQPPLQPVAGAAAPDQAPPNPVAATGTDEDGAASMLPQIETDGEIEPAQAATGQLFGSDDDYRKRTDLRHVVDPAEIRAAERQARQLATAIRYRLSRRYETRAHGRQLDLRKTLRANLSHGGEPLTLVHRSPPTRPVRIVVFLDVSGSMQHYSRFFLQLLKGLVNEWFDTDAYLFHTRLIRVTEVLREKDAMLAMNRLSLLAEGFGGGTNLSRALCSFNGKYAKSTLTSRTVVFILGDGYDTGGAERLAEELAQLKRRVRRLVWLNPLLGWENYSPTNASMKAALPHIDIFAAANTLESLARIEPMLERL